MESTIIIEFVDSSQDFTHWEVLNNGKVINSFPHQGHIWNKYKVLNPSNLKPGDHPYMQLGLKKFLLRHKILAITKHCTWENYCAKKALEPLTNIRYAAFRKGGKNA